MRLKPKTQTKPHSTAGSERSSAAVDPRPGLPISLFGEQSARARFDRNAMRDAAAAASAARAAEDDVRNRSADEEQNTEVRENDPTAGLESGTAVEGEAAGDGGAAAEEGGATDEVVATRQTAGQEQSATPAQRGAAAPAQRAFPKVRPPPIPSVPLPDMTGIRTPLVPPPPKKALRRRDKLLESTGLTPESHHASVQQGMNRVADLARNAQRDVVFQVGGIAFNARAHIEQLAGRIPDIVGGAVARVRAVNNEIRAEITRHARDEIRRVADHVDVAQGDMEQGQTQTNVDMQRMLMEEAPQVLREAKDEMDRQLEARSTEAAAKIASIPGGTQPTPIDNGVPASGNASANETDSGEGEQSISPVTFDAAKSALSGELMQDMPDNRLAQYGNLQCNASLDDLVPPRAEAYADANEETRNNLTSAENKARFFDTTFQLILPITHDEEVDDHDYRGNLDDNMREEYMHLSRDKQRVIRQIDEKLTHVLEEKLNPDHKDSLPYGTIKGLREAGEQVEQGLMDQARTVEASLKTNLAQLVQTYPDLVARLQPMVEGGEFLEAVSTLQRLAEAEASIGALREGQIASVAEQATQALAQARASFAQQVAGIHKSARKGMQVIRQTEGLAKYDFSRAATAYTGVIDDGVRTVFPQLHAHMSGLARRLLGPKTNKDQSFSNIETAAINYLNNVISGEWSGYAARINGLKDSLGGVQTGAEGAAGTTARESNGGTPFRSIRDGVRSDTLDRANEVVNALPEQPSTAALAFGYVVFPGPLATGIVHYMTDPDEDQVVTALSIPWPGPNAVEQRHQEYASGSRTLRDLIRERMDEDERQPVLDLFSASAETRSDAKQTLLNNSGWFDGIDEDAAMALSRSFTADELSAEVMSPAERDRLAENLRHTLSGPNEEIAAAYINGEPDLALAIRLRQHFDSMRGKSQDEQLQAGSEMQRIIQEELFMSGSRGYVPQARLDRMRDAAFLRFDEVARQGRSRVTIDREGPVERPTGEAPLTVGQIGQPPPAPPATTGQAAAQATAPDTTAEPAATAGTPSQTAPEPAPEPPSEAAAETPAREEPGQDIAEQTERAHDLEAAREVVIAYMNRPLYRVQRRPGDRYLEESIERRPTVGNRQRSYDPETGRLTVSPHPSVAAYNEALIRHGPSSPEARAARASATYNRVSRSSFSLSTNETNQLNASFSHNEFAAMRVRWQNASPRQRAAMAPQWEAARERHEQFLRLTAQGMGMAEDRLDDPEAVQAFVQTRLGRQFAREGEQFRRVGEQIVGQGRIAIDTGMDLAAGGDYDGTNEALIRNVLANRSQAELNERARGGLTMGEYARHLVNREIEGDDWQQADIDLMGIPENDLDRAAIAQRRYEHQREEGTGFIARRTMQGQSETRWLEQSRNQVDDRILAATQAGLEQAGRRGVDVSQLEMPANPRLPDGTWHPLVRRFAMDGDGNLRGTGPLMTSLANDVEQTSGFYRAEIDRQEAMLTGAITVLAIVVSVALMFIPGVNLIAAGILSALIAGAATITVKAGMRGGRYGWEEMATDMASTAIEAATAGIGGALSKGASAAAKAVQAGRQAQNLGRVARVGAAMQSRFGPKLAPVAQEAMTGAMSTAASSALDDRVWDDGLGMGIARVAGQGLKGAASSAANAGLSGSLTRRMEGRLTPDVADGEQMKKLNHVGRALGPNGREMITEIVSNVGGSLSSEGINILYDVATGKHKGGITEALKRLGKSGLQELASSAGRTSARQTQRARYRRMAAAIQAEGRDPSPGEARLLRRIGESGGVVEPGTSTAAFAAEFSRTRSRMAEMPPALRQQMLGMDPASASRLIAVMDSGQPGTRAQRRALVQDLAKNVPGLDADSFDRLLLRANEEHAPTRRARRQQIKAVRKRLLVGVRGPERALLAELDVADMVGLPSATLRRFAKVVADGDTAINLRKVVADMLPDDPGLRRRVSAQLEQAVKTTSDARKQVRTRHARARDDLVQAAPTALRDDIAALKPRDIEALQRYLKDGSEQALARAEAVLRAAVPGMDAARAKSVARRMADAGELAQARFAHLDNVPAELRDVISQLPDDALMELRVAQYTRKPLADDRVDAIVAAVKKTRPGADIDALRDAIGKTMRHAHGRPGFREALAQKRALLDMIPFGMKRSILKTPVLTLPESAFLSYVRGKGNENAVTLIVNGKPVILVREGANPRVLAEEGVHVLQYQDPEFRDRVSGLEEGRMARWDEAPIEQQIAAYQAKMEIEINAQRRIIARLEKRAASALWPGARRQALHELDVARDNLASLKRRVGRAAAFSEADLLRMALDPDSRPNWLKQPARMFNKAKTDAELFDRVMPGAEGKVRDALIELSAGMSRRQKLALFSKANLLVGSMQETKLVDQLGVIRKLSPDQRLRAIQDEVLMLAPHRQSEAARLAGKLDEFFANREKSTDEQALIGNIKDSLSKHDASEPLELRLAKRALLLRLGNLPPGSKHTQVLELMGYAAAVLDIAPKQGQIAALRGSAKLQADILVGLSVTKRYFDQPKASDQKFFTEMNKLVSSGFDGLTRADLRDLTSYFVRSFFEGASNKHLESITAMVGKIKSHNADVSRTQRLHFRDVIYVLRRNSGRDLSNLVSGLGPLIEKGMGRSATPPGGPKVTADDISHYMRKALNDAAFMDSFKLIANRARDGNLSDSDIAALLAPAIVARAQEKGFIERHPRFAEDDIDPLLGNRELMAEDLRDHSPPPGDKLGLSIHEARSIAKRMEVLEQTVLFSHLTDSPRTRRRLLEEFFKQIQSEVTPKPTGEKAIEARGRYIEEAFRAFVRHKAKETITGIAASAQGDRSPSSRRAIIDLLLRGKISLASKKGQPLLEDLPDSVREQVEKAQESIVEQYMRAMGDELPDGVTADIIGARLELGVFDLERSGKGKMMEHQIRHILSLAEDLDLPEAVRRVYRSFADLGVDKRGKFMSVDQLARDPERTKDPRSVDHILQVDEQAEQLLHQQLKQMGEDGHVVMDPQVAQLPLDLKPGRMYGADSKNGEGAFDPQQFKRYFIEMLKSLPRDGHQPDSIFGAGKDKLAGLIYLSNNAENMAETQRHVQRILKEILEPVASGKPLRVTIGDQTFDLEADFGITREVIVNNLRNNKEHSINIVFARLGQTGTADAADLPAQTQVGPFAFAEPGESVQQTILRLLGETEPKPVKSGPVRNR